MTEKIVTPTRMETLVLLRDECRALSNALDLAMVDGYGGDQLRELMRRAVGLAGSLGVWVGVATQSIDERIEAFMDEQELSDERWRIALARFAWQAGLIHASTLRELETERIESARLREERDTLLTCKELAANDLRIAGETIAKLTLELEQVRSLVGRA